MFIVSINNKVTQLQEFWRDLVGRIYFVDNLGESSNYSVFFYYESNVVNSLRGEGLVVEPIISLAYMIDDFHWIMNDKSV
jgi:hypothetical protein